MVVNKAPKLGYHAEHDHDQTTGLNNTSRSHSCQSDGADVFRITGGTIFTCSDDPSYQATDAFEGNPLLMVFSSGTGAPET